MSEKQGLKHLEGVILGQALLDELQHHVVHDLHEAGQFLLGELLFLGEVAIQMSELIYSRDNHLEAGTVRFDVARHF